MKFLIVKTSSLGDIIHTFPVVDYLRKKVPGCHIDWVVEEEYLELVRSHPRVTRVLPIATRRWRRALLQKRSFSELRQARSSLKETCYDAIFDLQGNTKSAFITANAKGLKKVGYSLSSAPEWLSCLATYERYHVSPELPIQHRYLSIVQQFFKDVQPFEPQGVELQLTLQENEKLASYRAGGQTRIMVAFASKWENKCLSLPTLVEFLKYVYEEEASVFYFVCGTDSEKRVADELASHFPESMVIQQPSIPLWQRMMSEMNLVVAVDSAALALCGTTKAPSFSFFGPTKASVYKPVGTQHQHFQGECPYGVSFTARCPRLRSCATGACLKSADASLIFKARALTSSQ